MEKYLQKISAFFKSKPDVLFFYLFLITSTLSVRKVLYYIPINNSFNEYTGIYIYLSDIFFFLTIFFWLIFILCNNEYYLSIYKETISNCSTWNNFFGLKYFLKNRIISHLKNFIFNKSQSYKQVIHNYALFFPLLMGLFSFVSILWATNQNVAFYRSIKLFEFILLFYYIIFRIVPRGTFLINQNIQLFHVEQFKTAIINPDANVKTNCSTWNNSQAKLFQNEVNSKCSTWNILKNSLFIVIISGIIQSIIAIWQFILQHSIGLLWLKESIISPMMPGVAKVILNETTYIRAYGLFPHPNILGGLLVFSIISTILYRKLFHLPAMPPKTIQAKRNFFAMLFHVEQLINIARQAGVEQLQEKNTDAVKCSTWNILLKKLFSLFAKIVPRGTILNLMLLIQVISLFLTFSKSAIFGLLAGLFYIFIKTKSLNVPRGTFLEKQRDHKELTNCSTWNNCKLSRYKITKLFHVEQFINIARQAGVEQFIKKTLLIFTIIILLLINIKPDINSLLVKSLQEREFYINVSRGTFSQHPFFGLGSGQFIFALQNIVNIQPWQFQPVHNVFLLVANEYGIFVLLGFLLFIYSVFQNCSTQKKLFHVEQLPGQAWNNLKKGIDQSILINHYILIYLKAILLSFLFIMLFDHYFWDIPQGQILLWMTLGFILGFKRDNN